HKEAAVKILKLPKEKLDLFASVVQQFGELHAPVEQDGKYAFKRLARWSDARLEYDRTILPPKKYYLPPRETLFRYRPGEGFVPHTEGLDQRIILFGVHACDVYAINILDRVFAGKYHDPYYQARRANNTTTPPRCPRTPPPPLSPGAHKPPAHPRPPLAPQNDPRPGGQQGRGCGGVFLASR